MRGEEVKVVYATPWELRIARTRSWDALMAVARRAARVHGRRVRIRGLYELDRERWTYVIECPPGCRDIEHAYRQS